MGDLIDLDEKRRERQAKADRSSKAYVPKDTPLIDQDWDNELGRLVETVHVPPYHRDRDFGDES